LAGDETSTSRGPSRRLDDDHAVNALLGERAIFDGVSLLALTIDERATRRVDETVVRFVFRDAGPRR
jgi:hypothetical protein